MRNHKPSTILKKALALLGDRGQRWIKGTSEVHPGEKHKGKLYRNRAFCSMGAFGYLPYGTLEAESFLREAIGGGSIVWFNDGKATTFPMVRKAFKKAIALAKAEGQ